VRAHIYLSSKVKLKNIAYLKRILGTI